MKRGWLVLLIAFVVSSTLFSSAFAQAASPQVLLWQSATLVAVGQGPQTLLAVGDVTGDGIPDIVCDHDGIIYYRGKGDGIFVLRDMAGVYKWVPDREQPSGVKMYTAVNSFGLSGALGDFDDDGDLDLAVIALDPDENIDKLFVFRNDYHGSFTPVSSQPLGRHDPKGAWKVWAQDVNGDGEIDLVIARENDNKATIYLMYGEGNLSFRTPEKVGEGAGSAFFFGDVNGDSRVDIALEDGQQVTVLLGNGKGDFLPGPRFTVEKGEEIHKAALADLNRDGSLDLVLAMGKNGLVIARQTKTGFTKVASYALGNIKEVRCADFTGDGVPDVFTWIDGQGYVVLPGDGKGGVGNPIGGYLPSPLATRLIWSGDLNGDGRADLLFSGFGDELLFPVMNGGTPHGETYLAMGGSRLLAVGDIDHDGDLDLLAEGSNGLDVFRNAGTGMLQRQEFSQGGYDPLAGAVAGDRVFILNNTESGASLEVFSPIGEQLGTYALGTGVMPLLVAGDFDGDGRNDVIAIVKRAILILWGGEKGIMKYTWRKGDLSVACGGDFNGDGKDELAFISTDKYADMYIVSFPKRALRISGKPLHLPAVPLAMAAGDIDGDGLSDPVTIGFIPSIHKEGDEMKVSITGALVGMILSQSGPKTYRLPDFPQGDAPWPFTGLAVGDVTGDGKADLIYSLTSGHGAYILPGNGDGTFGKAKGLYIGLGPLFTGDIDGNGQTDLIASTLGFNPSIFIRFNGGER